LEVRLRASVLVVLLALPLSAGEAPSRGQATLDTLNQTIGWYRRVAAQAQLATEPADVIFVDQNLHLTRQVLALSFEAARAAAALPGVQTAAPGTSANLSKRASDAEAAVQKIQAEANALERRVASSGPRTRAVLQAQLAETRSELVLAQTRAQVFKTLADFAVQGGAGGGFLGQIDELERAVPEVRAEPAAHAAPTAQAAAAGKPANGVLGLFSELFSLARKRRELHDVGGQTNALRSQSDKLRAPLEADVRATMQEGDQLTAEPDPTDPGLLAERKKRLDELTDHFKKTSAALIPLGKEAVLLDAVRANLAQWEASTDNAYDLVFRSLALRLALLAAVVALVIVGSGLWRRATFRYVRDLKRRQVSLLVRRIVVTAVVSIAVVFSLVSEIGSLATFAGFLTAGLAVALQNVILSIAAYFFLIGKYGLRVGERVQIGNVIGDVLDIGLVRLHVMETGPDGLPTGRVVVFSNAVVFTGPNLFRPLPGTNFAWHQLKLTLATDTDHRLAEKRLLRAVSGVVDDYRSSIERQHAEMAQTFAIPLQTPRPESRLHLSEAGLEILVRYPVPLDEAAAADDRVTRAVLEAIEDEPQLRLVGSASATLQPVAP
jgi:small-conductance mechanosensitive channel